MAAITGLSLANLKTRIFRARQALKLALSHERIR
jgi:DNA-directed RNA polymerase specialized sigma24 family protein